MEQAEVEAKLAGYATEFIRGYSETIDRYYADAKQQAVESGLLSVLFPLYRRVLGTNLVVAAMFTANDFYLFFVDARDTTVTWKDGDEAPEFSQEWTLTAPDARRVEQVKEYLGLADSPILHLSPGVEALNAPGGSFISHDISYIQSSAYDHGNNFGKQAGARAAQTLPILLRDVQQAEKRASFAERYDELVSLSGMTEKARGTAFEQLWHDVLKHYNWQPKKFRIPGEENDFTAIYQGLHILGEVRWHAKRMNGRQMREFLAKLDPRPQTTGLFISHSGLNDGAKSALKRSANTKTVVVFEREEIEKILRACADPGPIFDEKLRDAYDYIFEQGQTRP